MKYTIEYLPSLSRDIYQISETLARYPNKAKRLFKEMDEKLLCLTDTPFMWEIFHAQPKYRKVVLEDHLLFYTVDEEQRIVRVCRILYHRMNATLHLGE